MSICCHWDEGYEEGFESGKKAAPISLHLLVNALELAAVKVYDLRGEWERGDALRDVARDLQYDGVLSRLLEREFDAKRAAA